MHVKKIVKTHKDSNLLRRLNLQGRCASQKLPSKFLKASTYFFLYDDVRSFTILMDPPSIIYSNDRSWLCGHLIEFIFRLYKRFPYEFISIFLSFSWFIMGWFNSFKWKIIVRVTAKIKICFFLSIARIITRNEHSRRVVNGQNEFSRLNFHVNNNSVSLQNVFSPLSRLFHLRTFFWKEKKTCHVRAWVGKMFGEREKEKKFFPRTCRCKNSWRATSLICISFASIQA